MLSDEQLDEELKGAGAHFLALDQDPKHPCKHEVKIPYV